MSTKWETPFFRFSHHITPKIRWTLLIIHIKSCIGFGLPPLSLFSAFVVFEYSHHAKWVFSSSNFERCFGRYILVIQMVFFKLYKIVSFEEDRYGYKTNLYILYASQNSESYLWYSKKYILTTLYIYIYIYCMIWYLKHLNIARLSFNLPSI